MGILVGDSGRYMWCYWDERNRRTFEGVSKKLHTILDGILIRLHRWMYLMQSREAPPLSSWIFDWNTLLY